MPGSPSNLATMDSKAFSSSLPRASSGNRKSTVCWIFFPPANMFPINANTTQAEAPERWLSATATGAREKMRVLLEVEEALSAGALRRRRARRPSSSVRAHD